MHFSLKEHLQLRLKVIAVVSPSFGGIMMRLS